MRSAAWASRACRSPRRPKPRRPNRDSFLREPLPRRCFKHARRVRARPDMSTPQPLPPSPWQIYRRLLGWSRRYWPLLSVALLGMIVEAGAAGAFTAVMKPIIDVTFVARQGTGGLMLPLAIVGLFVL